MQRGKRGTRYVADVLADLERVAAPFSDELPEPARLPYLTAVGFAVLQNVDPLDVTSGVQCDRIIDIEMLPMTWSSTIRPSVLPPASAFQARLSNAAKLVADGKASFCACATERYWTA